MSAQIEFFKGNGFIAEVIRTKRRKTATVTVKEGKVSVIIPKNLPDTRIEELVTKKTRWIREKMHLHNQSSPLRQREYVSGESFTYLGKNYRLKVICHKDRSVKLLNGRLVVALPDGSNNPNKVIDALTRWFRGRAEDKLREKVERYSKVLGVNPSSVTVKSFKSRWGSCHINGDVQFNWKVIMAPTRIVDYVVVHELCHLKQHNHSPKYWKCVDQVFPDYAECKDWLKVNGRNLDL